MAVQQKIINQAKAAGLNPEMMLQIAAMESGGNANAISATGAIGIDQFTGKTATGVRAGTTRSGFLKRSPDFRGKNITQMGNIFLKTP